MINLTFSGRRWTTWFYCKDCGAVWNNWQGTIFYSSMVFQSRRHCENILIFNYSFISPIQWSSLQILIFVDVCRSSRTMHILLTKSEYFIQIWEMTIRWTALSLKWKLFKLPPMYEHFEFVPRLFLVFFFFYYIVELIQYIPFQGSYLLYFEWQVDLAEKEKTIPPCDLYYDMSYSLKHLTFANLLTGTGYKTK